MLLSSLMVRAVNLFPSVAVSLHCRGQLANYMKQSADVSVSLGWLLTVPHLLIAGGLYSISEEEGRKGSVHGVGHVSHTQIPHRAWTYSE